MASELLEIVFQYGRSDKKESTWTEQVENLMIEQTAWHVWEVIKNI